MCKISGLIKNRFKYHQQKKLSQVNIHLLLLMSLISMDTLKAQELSFKLKNKKQALVLVCKIANQSGSDLVLGLPELLNLEDTIQQQPYYIDDYGVFFRLDTSKSFTMKLIIDTSKFRNKDSLEVFFPIENPMNASKHLYVIVYKNGKVNWYYGPAIKHNNLVGGRNRIRIGEKKYTVKL